MMKNYLKNYTSLLFITLIISLLLSEQSYAQFTLASDNANDAAYSASFNSGQNGGNGYSAWAISYGTSGTGSFIGDPAGDGMSNTGIGNNAFAFYATGSDYLNAERGFDALELNDELSFYWAMNYDAGSGSKGFALKNGGTNVFNVNNAGVTDITTTNGTATSTYGTDAMLVTIKRVLANDYEFSMTSKSGGTTYTTTFNSTSTLDNINIFIGNQNDSAGQRNIYFNNFEIKNDANFNIANGTEIYTKIFTGTGALTKSGSGILVLTGNHTYSGATTVDTGILKLQGNLTNSDVTVKSGATLEIDGNITVKSITVEEGGYIKVNSGKTLTLTNDLTLNSTSISYSSLISDGTITGTVYYERYVNSNDPVNGNDLISAPLSGQAFNTFIANNPNIPANPANTQVLFGGFNNNNTTYEIWEDTATTPLIAGKGYRSGISVGASSNLVTFEGTVNSSLVQIPINQGSTSKLNLIGNPFPSYLDAQLFLSHNAALLEPSAQAIYGYNDSTNDTSAGVYTIINKILNTNVDIAPGQAFFVTSGASGGNMEFTTSSSDMRLASGGDDIILGRNSSVITNFKLNLSNSTDNFITDIFFTEFSTQGLDPGYDASLIGGTAPSFAIYSHLVQDNIGIPFALQALGETDYANITIPLGVNANQGEQISFHITDNSLPTSVEIYLDDNVANTSTLLTNEDYIITPSVNLSGTGRFYLRTIDSALSTPQNTLDNLYIYSNENDKTIDIAGQLIETTLINIYDIQGRIVNTSLLQTENRSQTIDVSHLSRGVYVVQLTNGTQSKTQKVIIQ